MSRYTFTCMTPGCGYRFVVEASGDSEAVDMIMEMGGDHDYENHPEMPILTTEKKRSIVEKGIRKIE